LPYDIPLIGEQCGVANDFWSPVAAEGALADVHSLDQARMFNFDCWIYGSDPAGNADIVGDATLPEDRAGGCEDEYNQLVRAWNALPARTGSSCWREVIPTRNFIHRRHLERRFPVVRGH
jgi:hypothetical protein